MSDCQPRLPMPPTREQGVYHALRQQSPQCVTAQGYGFSVRLARLACGRSGAAVTVPGASPPRATRSGTRTRSYRQPYCRVWSCPFVKSRPPQKGHDRAVHASREGTVRFRGTSRLPSSMIRSSGVVRAVYFNNQVTCSRNVMSRRPVGSGAGQGIVPPVLVPFPL